VTLGNQSQRRCQHCRTGDWGCIW